MAIIKWSQMSPKMFWRMPDLWDDEDWSMDDHQGLTVYETENSVWVKANVAGVPEDKVDVSVEGGTVTIKAEHEETEEEKKRKKVVYRQAREAKYLYTTSIPCPVKAEKAEAEVENGVLILKLPKAEAVKPKKIAVKTKKK